VYQAISDQKKSLAENKEMILKQRFLDCRATKGRVIMALPFLLYISTTKT
jgi:hypothetical protein